MKQRKRTWVKTKAEATTFTTTADGLVDITGLKYGTYYLEETVAPDDYVLLTNRIEFVVNEQSYGTTENLVSPEKVPNKHKGTFTFNRWQRNLRLLRKWRSLATYCRVYFARRRKENA